MSAQLKCGLAYLKYCFSVEAIDSRVQPDIDYLRRQKAAALDNDSEVKEINKSSRPLWHTTEFKFYYLAFVIVVPWMIKTAMDASNETNLTNYYKFENLLSSGWLFGRKVDNSDSQYRFFRDNLFLLIQLMTAHLVIKRIILYVTKINVLRFDFIFGLIFLFAAHGVNSIRILTHMIVMFSLVHLLKRHRNWAIALTWIYGIGSLFLNDKYRSVPFSSFCSILKPLDTAFKGIIPRWDVFFNFTLLRIISYNLDYLERLNNQLQFRNSHEESSEDYEEFTRSHTDENNNNNDDNDIQINKPSIKKSGSVSRLQTIDESGKAEVLNERARLIAPHHIQEYSFVNFIAYVTYTPLFIAGPIITFNDYIYQSQHKLPSITLERITIYSSVLAFTILAMEFILHFTYVVAVSKAKAWENDSPFQISMIGLFNLNIIWLKLLIPWRFFRLWAMLDGIDTPENMIRLVDNNYSALAFWRGWHRSFNKWVVRYIYIPLGGSRNRILTSLAVFSFVAVWHDIELRLLLWGWLIVIFLLPEIFLSQYFQMYRNKWWYRHVCALGGTVNIYMMMIANLFGFCLGSDGTKMLLHDMFMTSAGFTFFIISTVCLFIAVQIMFEIREDEKRHGINLKC
ncbi:similar to Saccharomyces cerevisiae YGL084C GUP1 Plasma membrane protein involved in remodeling GPI anchors [Maudiozyma saulgeensis]|uniref:Similar to Saccharomyces cerevisiae YGL084C GUP1 Plasma membrane protein involved in remodeling GPI anchors n=1 Tax=Maudiozyma saulgeensis TaxID=1789683 RepID=A0A1X7RA70_9SACH|nr:similar to Saccharomyces cerevisiae YGL084C GUP1 Plasma membrane protein involved in remodeling GPI anchors [Kazachstania saulgeensis]